MHIPGHACLVQVSVFVNAESSREIVFTRNATEAINLVAYGWAMHHLKLGDEVDSFLQR